MSKKQLGLDSMGIQKTMRLGDYLADSGGQFALNSISGLIGAITYFYTDKIGVAAMTAANVLLIAKIVDAFTDLIMGRIMDNGKSPKGKCRPWFLRMAIPAFVVIVALFSVPSGLSSPMLFAYLLITNVLASAVVSTAISIPYNAIQCMRTPSIEERTKMGIFRSIMGYLIGMIIAIALVPITNLLGVNGVADQAAYIKFAVVLGLISMVLLLILYAKSVEKTTAEQKQDDGVPFVKSIGMLFKNKYWVIVLISNLFSAVIFALTSASGTYYAKWILGNDNLVALMGAVGLISTFVGFGVVGPMTKKLGIRKTLMISLIIGIAGSVVRIFFPDSLIVLMTAGQLTSFAIIPLMCVCGTMNTMAMDYNDYLYGNKIVGMSASASSFGSKVAGGLGGSLIGWILAAVNYDPNATVTTTAVRYGIYAFSIYIPLAMMVALLLLTSRFDIENRYTEILRTIQARKKTQSPHA
jgi:sugar (glycoside-pentoside-hexuronide) transporter